MPVKTEPQLRAAWGHPADPLVPPVPEPNAADVATSALGAVLLARPCTNAAA